MPTGMENLWLPQYVWLVFQMSILASMVVSFLMLLTRASCVALLSHFLDAGRCWRRWLQRESRVSLAVAAREDRPQYLV